MDDDIARVRRFTRQVTQRVGVLNDDYLARDRPLGASRLLWEIRDGAEVKDLRVRLDLDSGYVSRLLRSLEADGLVSVGAKDGDRRVRVARLTEAGWAERKVLDQRSDEVAASLLAPLNDRQRERLVAAMDEVDRLLTAGLVTVEQVDPDHPDARASLAEYFAEIDRRFDAGFDPAEGIPAEGDQVRPPNGMLLVARLRERAVGCGALRFHRDTDSDTDGEVGHIKRMWVADDVRGLGIGRRLLAELESRAARHGCVVVRLDTNKALTEAIGMYRAAGYVEVEAFNDERYAHHWFEKTLGTPRSAASRS
jgi:DNA-binding MarR family transcriptional regulator/ribosomal protein S18 acetylase RimI-like enzyme